MYDPTHGRFLSEDPMNFAAGDADLSRYVGNNPANYVDPSGLLASPLQQAIDYIKGNFNGMGLCNDILNSILDAQKNNKIKFSDTDVNGIKIFAGNYSYRDDTIRISTKYQADPLGIAFTLIHEATHRVLSKCYPKAKPSQYEEYLAYAYETLFYQKNFKDSPLPKYNDLMGPNWTIDPDSLWKLTQTNYPKLPVIDPNLKPPAALPPGVKLPVNLR